MMTGTIKNSILGIYISTGIIYVSYNHDQEVLNIEILLQLSNAKKLKCLQTQMQIGDLESLVWVGLMVENGGCCGCVRVMCVWVWFMMVV